MANLTIGLFGADILIVVRILISHLGSEGKEIGLGVVALLAIVDVAFLAFLRRRQPEPSRRPSHD